MIPVPDLDDIDFDALVEEGRALIPRYAPDWTDHNVHDPGITLLELLAWVIDLQIYRIGFVGDSHLRAFAALLGAEPRPARPARGLLWPAAGGARHEQALTRGTRAWPVRDPGLIFTTAADLRLSGAPFGMTAGAAGKPAKVRSDGSGAIRLDPATDWLELNLARPLFAGATAAATIAVGLEFAGPLADLEPDFALPIAFDYRTGDGVWHRAGMDWIDGGARRSGAALLDIAAGAAGVSAIRLDFTRAPVRALPTRVALDVLPLVQIETLASTMLGRSPGLPDLELSLGAGMLPAPDAAHNPLEVLTLELGGRVEWSRVAGLGPSGPEDCHYTLDEDGATIRFGNGVNGRIPPPGRQVDRGALDVTAGTKGNLIAGVSWSVEGVPAEAARWTNHQAMSGGCDAWDREALLTDLRRRSQERSAMLTDAELRDAAAGLRGFGLERAEVLPRFLPTLPHRPVPGARTLLLHPSDGVRGGDAWIDAIERRLAPRRVLGERLSLAAAEPVPIAVSAELLIAAGSDRPSIEDAVRARLQARLSATRRSPAIEPWPSGRPVTIGELEALIAGAEGVIAVPRLRIGARGDAPDRISVPLARIEVAVAGRIELAVRVEA
ncbi:MAG TPA: baseplate J/gp47 family protein [Allosphingosinicella sp.]|nr:baseplate J/gp47 family protein [Allosphingosinicella sp.]